jgi:Putative auto-transporter adhesin, head GIN domain
MRTAGSSVAVMAAASLLLLTGCSAPLFVINPSETGASDDGSPQASPDESFLDADPLQSETREITAVTTVVLDTAGDLVITRGEPSLVIHASEDTLGRLTSDIEGDVLVLGTEPGVTFGEVRYELTVPDLGTVELSGSGDIEWADVDGDRTEVRLSGSGDIELAGATLELAISIDGSGEVDAEDVDAQNASIAIDGSGEVAVSARDTLDVEISGSGRVTYVGDPSLTTNVSGSGEIVRE